MHFYLAFGLIVESEIILSGLLPYEGVPTESEIKVSLAKVPTKLINPPTDNKPFTVFNEWEFLYHITDRFKIYVKDGKEVILELLHDDLDEMLMYFYSNGLSAALYQRKMIPFHVSGIQLNESEVILFAAPSRTGKSTTAVKLLEKGYRLFTDDTAIFRIEKNEVYAKASYPMTRMWKKTIIKQKYFNENDKIKLFQQSEYEKFGFLFHQEFSSNEFKVKGIIFLEIAGSEITIEPLSKSEAIQSLAKNIFKRQWIKGMGLEIDLFFDLSAIGNKVPAYVARRPQDKDTFDEFAQKVNDFLCQL